MAAERDLERERKSRHWTTQIKECALFFFLLKEPKGGNSTSGIKACVSPIYCSGSSRQYISDLLVLYRYCSSLLPLASSDLFDLFPHHILILLFSYLIFSPLLPVLSAPLFSSPSFKSYLSSKLSSIPRC